MSQHASKTLQRKRKHLVSDFLKGKTVDFLDSHTRLHDDYFCESFEKSKVGPIMDIAKNPYAIIALGGYGRGEQCLFSDIDLLFLFRKRIPSEAENLIREIVYPLWDIGLDVGHATRSVSESVKLAGNDLEVLTSLLDSRFVCGMSNLYFALMEELQKKVVRSRSKKIISMLVENNRERHRRFGDSAYLLEPNLKEGQGGLRDYHTMLWIARIQSNLKQPRDLEYTGYLSQDEFATFSRALLFVREVRNHLHFMTGRKCDQLYFEYQEKLAGKLKIKKVKGRHPVESFLGSLHNHMEFIKQRHLIFLAEMGYTGRSKHKKRIVHRNTNIRGLTVNRDMLHFSSTHAVMNSPDLMITIFVESADLGIPLSAEAKRVIKEFSYLIDADFRSSDSVVSAFEQILMKPDQEFNVLNEMLNTGFLTELIPEIKKIVNRIQHDEYHLYPVARHSLYTVQTVKQFSAAKDSDRDPLYARLYRELASQKKTLLWAALLHDIGKGASDKDHSARGAGIARTILKRTGLKSDVIETVAFLIKEHLLFIKTATRRDINEEGTAIFCARKIKDIKRLKMLYLLTIADSIATGPKAWNDWTETLLRELFFKVLNIFENGELASREAVESIQKKKKKVIASMPNAKAKGAMEKLFEHMSPRYLLYADPGDIMDHAALFNRLDKTEFVWNVQKDGFSDTRTVTVCAKDRPGLFSKIAGSFTLSNLDILDAQIYTWRNQIALDIFKVKPPPDRIFEDEKWSEAEEHLRAALSQKLDLADALKEKMVTNREERRPVGKRPHRIEFDNRSSDFFTIIEVFTYDFPGLLFGITHVFYKNNLDVWIAKIATKIDQVVDVFYVRSTEGEKIDSPDIISRLKAQIKEVIAQRDPSKLTFH